MLTLCRDELQRRPTRFWLRPQSNKTGEDAATPAQVANVSPGIRIRLGCEGDLTRPFNEPFDEHASFLVAQPTCNGFVVQNVSL